MIIQTDKKNGFQYFFFVGPKEIVKSLKYETWCVKKNEGK